MINGNFGRIDSSNSQRLMGSAPSNSRWVSDSSVVIKNNAGAGNTRRVHSTVQQQIGTSPGIVSFDYPVANNYIRANIPLTGGTSLTLTGGKFGALNHSPRVRVGRTQSSTIQFVSDSSLRVKVPLATSGTNAMSLAVSLLLNLGTSTFAASYDLGVITSSKSSNQPATGAARVTHTGCNFGSGILSLGTRLAASAAEMSEWVSGIPALPFFSFLSTRLPFFCQILPSEPESRLEFRMVATPPSRAIASATPPPPSSPWTSR